jgi:L-2,4-diaminobutyrate decarboxylase
MIASNITEALRPNNHQEDAKKDLKSLIFSPRNINQYQHKIDLGLDLIKDSLEKNNRVFSGIKPKDLADIISPIDLQKPLASSECALAELKEIYLDDAVYFHHPQYLAHLNCPIAHSAALAELIISSINSSVDTWDQSAGATLIEQKLVDWCCQLLKLGPLADGVFTSGGTQSNLMALLLARDQLCRLHFPEHDIKRQGLPLAAHGKIRIFSSAVSHFSIQKAAAILGLGYDAVISVECDEHFCLKPQALNQAIDDCLQQGLLPMAIVATAGTTDFGSIDPLQSIGEICQRHNIWFHTDAAYGCGLLSSKSQRHRLSGIEHSDSVTIDFHKSFLQPVSCSALMVKQADTLATVTHHAEYLNPLSAKQQGTPNLVDKSLQTTRRFDALKLWLTLRIDGLDAIGDVFDYVCSLAMAGYQQLVSDNDFEVIHRPEMSTLVFRYCPIKSRDERFTSEQLNQLNNAIRATLMRSGEALIAATTVDNIRYLKVTLLNPATETQHLATVFSLIKRYGEQHLATMFSRSPEISADMSGLATLENHI